MAKKNQNDCKSCFDDIQKSMQLKNFYAKKFVFTTPSSTQQANMKYQKEIINAKLNEHFISKCDISWQVKVSWSILSNKRKLGISVTCLRRNIGNQAQKHETNFQIR